MIIVFLILFDFWVYLQQKRFYAFSFCLVRVIEYKFSELRVIELLNERLCSSLDEYTLVVTNGEEVRGHFATSFHLSNAS